MKRGLITLIAFTTAALQANWASAGDRREGFSALALQQHCDECHAIRDAAIGPPFLAVAARYAPDRAMATERLAQKIINGGSGNWGTIPMVQNERVSLADARRLAQWILSLARAK